MKSAVCFFVLLVVFACSKHSTSPEAESDYAALHNFRVSQVGYDRLRISSDGDISLDDQYVDSIWLSVFDGRRYVQEDMTMSVYTNNGDGYGLHFQFHVNVERTVLDALFRLTFRLDDGRTVSVDSSAQMIHYPYPSTEAFISADEVFTEYELFFQDFALDSGYLYFHPTGAAGVYAYDFSSGQTRELVSYPSGNHIALAGEYVFYEISGCRIYRYNLGTDTTDMEIDLSQLDYDYIWGMDVRDDRLVVLFERSPINVIGVFDLDGHLTESVDYPGNTCFLAIDGDLLYSIETDTSLSVFDFKRRFFLRPKKMPTDEWEGIFIHDGRFYYVDYLKRIICRMLVSDLEDI